MNVRLLLACCAKSGMSPLVYRGSIRFLWRVTLRRD